MTAAEWEGAGWPAVETIRSLSHPRWAWQGLILTPQAPWMDQEIPVVAIGVGLDRLPDWDEVATGCTSLLQAANDAGAWIGPTNRERIYRVLRWRHLSESAAEGMTAGRAG
jgi:hypothetical protein